MRVHLSEYLIEKFHDNCREYRHCSDIIVYLFILLTQDYYTYSTCRKLDKGDTF